MRPRLDPLRIAVALLLLWAAGLVVAAAQLDAWRVELSRTLMQLNADAQFRVRLARDRDAVDPQWYRRKALVLLAANEKLRDHAAWTLFIPGSWRMFDDLEERLAARIEHEFADIVVETIRRELQLRVQAITGGAGSGHCAAPTPPAAAARRLSAAPEDLAEYVAVREHLRQLQAFDQAAQAFLRLQRSSDPDPEELRALVRFTLGAELDGPLGRSTRLFRDREEVSIQPALLHAAWQAAARCSLTRGMAALHTRLLSSNELIALEQALAQHSAGLFEAARAPAFERAAERLRAVLAVLQDQDALLGQGRNGWMRDGRPRLGPGYEDLLRQVRQIGLLGPEVERQLQAQAGEAFQHFRREFEASFGTPGQAGIVWLESQQRFGLAPERDALRLGLVQLLQQPFMDDPWTSAKARENEWKTEALSVAEASQWMELRQRFHAEDLARFPPFARDAVARLVDTRVADLIYRPAMRGLRAGTGDFDLVAYRARSPQVASLRSMLGRLGAAAMADRLWAAHTEPVLKPLMQARQQWEQSALYQPQAGDFQWWQGEGGPLWQAFGAADAAAVQKSLAEQIAQLQTLSQQAAPLVEAAGPELARHPEVQRWAVLAQELDHWRAKRGDSSLLALERYLVAVGGDLRRDNCMERLTSFAPPRRDDGVAQRYLQLHDALVQRCTQLRAGSPAPAARPAAPVQPPLG